MGSRLPPAVRLHTVSDEGGGLGMGGGGGGRSGDSVLVELPVNQRNNFNVFTPNDDPNGGPSPVSAESGDFGQEIVAETEASTPTNASLPHLELTVPAVPRLSRAASMPVASQLSHLQHPHRSNPARKQLPGADIARYHELSLELADSVQLVIQTMLQISPTQLLDPAKEQFSACSLAVPTPSMSAMITAMKNLNYISANMSSFCAEEKDMAKLLDTAHKVVDTEHNDFDIGELLQSVGDNLSGAASKVDVDLVLFHGDVGMKHVFVRGDENGISYSLSHVMRQVLVSCQPGDSIEIGLFINAANPKNSEETKDASPSPEDGPLSCTVQFFHRFCDPSSSPEDTEAPKQPQTRPEPQLSSVILRRLLHQINATLSTNLPPPGGDRLKGRTCEVQFNLERGSDTTTNMQGESSDSPVQENSSTEPSLEQLGAFADTLRGKKVTLYANSEGSFARHLSSYLTAWGLDMSHVSERGAEAESSPPPSATTGSDSLPTPTGSLVPGSDAYVSGGTSPNPDAKQFSPHLPSFILIDDDVDALRERLAAIRQDQSFPSALVKKRPSLASHHRPRSSPQVARAMGQPVIIPPSPPVVLVHFTSLQNYKTVKDVIENVRTSYINSNAPLPEIMVIPKPAGPRRFLTALHTAITRPMVDPFFSPTATTPSTPSSLGRNSYLGPNAAAMNSPRSPPFSNNNNNRPVGSRSNSDRSTRSATNPPTEGGTGVHLPSSPLTTSVEKAEYFTTEAWKLGQSASSGLVIQSPDGQPAGIFFHPRSKTGRTPSAGASYMERDRNNLQVSTANVGAGATSRPTSRISRRPSEASQTSFSALQQAGSPKSPRTPNPVAGVNGSPTSVNATPKASMARKSSGGRSGASGGGGGEDGLRVNASGAAADMAGSGSGSGTGRTVSSPPTSPVREGVNGNAHGNGNGKGRRSLSSRQSTVDSTTSVSSQATVVPSSNANGTPGSGTGGGAPAPSRQASGGRLQAPPQKQGHNSSDAAIVPPISVLIVDDNSINRSILSTFMKKKKIKYDTAENGRQAVDKWMTGQFHLVLMDIQMPVMDGLEATKEIRRLEKANAAAGYPLGTPAEEQQMTPPLKSPASDFSTDTARANSPYRSSVIIVALTASNLQSDRVTALAAGCNDFLTKPVSLLWLNNKIIEWGSIKALQMWADLRPDATRSISQGQVEQAQHIAERLHMPNGRSKLRPSLDEDKLAPPGASGDVQSSAPSTAAPSSAFWTPEQPSPMTGAAFVRGREASSSDVDNYSDLERSPGRELSPQASDPLPNTNAAGPSTMAPIITRTSPYEEQDVANDVEEALSLDSDDEESDAPISTPDLPVSKPSLGLVDPNSTPSSKMTLSSSDSIPLEALPRVEKGADVDAEAQYTPTPAAKPDSSGTGGRP